MPNSKILDFLRKKVKGFILANGQKEKIFKGFNFANAQNSKLFGIYFCKIAQNLRNTQKYVLQKSLPLK